MNPGERFRKIPIKITRKNTSETRLKCPEDVFGQSKAKNKGER